jgi:hypothetical protein
MYVMGTCMLSRKGCIDVSVDLFSFKHFWALDNILFLDTNNINLLHAVFLIFLTEINKSDIGL